MANKKSDKKPDVQKKDVEKHIERSEDRRTGGRRATDKQQVTEVKKSNMLSFFLFLLGVISLAGIILVSYIGDNIANKLENQINDVSSIVSVIDADVDKVEERITTNQEQISAISDLSTENGDMIESIALAVGDNHSRIITAQKGVNRLVRAELIEYGYSGSLALAISNEISVNPTIARWDTLINNSKFNFEELNTRIDKLNENQ